MTESLTPLRSRIDELDNEIIHLLAKRFAVVRQVAQVKKSENIPAVLPERVEYVITRAASNAEPLGLEPAFAQKLYGIIVDEACKLEDKLIASS